MNANPKILSQITNNKVSETTKQSREPSPGPVQG